MLRCRKTRMEVRKARFRDAEALASFAATSINLTSLVVSSSTPNAVDIQELQDPLGSRIAKNKDEVTDNFEDFFAFRFASGSFEHDPVVEKVEEKVITASSSSSSTAAPVDGLSSEAQQQDGAEEEANESTIVACSPTTSTTCTRHGHHTDRITPLLEHLVRTILKSDVDVGQEAGELKWDSLPVTRKAFYKAMQKYALSQVEIQRLQRQLEQRHHQTAQASSSTMEYPKSVLPSSSFSESFQTSPWKKAWSSVQGLQQNAILSPFLWNASIADHHELQAVDFDESQAHKISPLKARRRAKETAFRQQFSIQVIHMSDDEAKAGSIGGIGGVGGLGMDASISLGSASLSSGYSTDVGSVAAFEDMQDEDMDDENANCYDSDVSSLRSRGTSRRPSLAASVAPVNAADWQQGGIISGAGGLGMDASISIGSGSASATSLSDNDSVVSSNKSRTSIQEPSLACVSVKAEEQVHDYVVSSTMSRTSAEPNLATTTAAAAAAGTPTAKSVKDEGVDDGQAVFISGVGGLGMDASICIGSVGFSDYDSEVSSMMSRSIVSRVSRQSSLAAVSVCNEGQGCIISGVDDVGMGANISIGSRSPSLHSNSASVVSSTMSRTSAQPSLAAVSVKDNGDDVQAVDFIRGVGGLGMDLGISIGSVRFSDDDSDVSSMMSRSMVSRVSRQPSLAAVSANGEGQGFVISSVEDVVVDANISIGSRSPSLHSNTVSGVSSKMSRTSALPSLAAVSVKVDGVDEQAGFISGVGGLGMDSGISIGSVGFSDYDSDVSSMMSRSILSRVSRQPSLAAVSANLEGQGFVISGVEDVGMDANISIGSSSLVDECDVSSRNSLTSAQPSLAAVSVKDNVDDGQAGIIGGVGGLGMDSGISIGSVSLSDNDFEVSSMMSRVSGQPSVTAVSVNGDGQDCLISGVEEVGTDTNVSIGSRSLVGEYDASSSISRTSAQPSLAAGSVSLSDNDSDVLSRMSRVSGQPSLTTVSVNGDGQDCIISGVEEVGTDTNVSIGSRSLVGEYDVSSSISLTSAQPSLAAGSVNFSDNDSDVSSRVSRVSGQPSLTSVSVNRDGQGFIISCVEDVVLDSNTSIGSTSLVGECDVSSSGSQTSAQPSLAAGSVSFSDNDSDVSSRMSRERGQPSLASVSLNADGQGCIISGEEDVGMDANISIGSTSLVGDVSSRRSRTSAQSSLAAVRHTSHLSSVMSRTSAQPSLASVSVKDNGAECIISGVGGLGLDSNISIGSGSLSSGDFSNAGRGGIISGVGGLGLDTSISIGSGSLSSGDFSNAGQGSIISGVGGLGMDVSISIGSMTDSGSICSQPTLAAASCAVLSAASSAFYSAAESERDLVLKEKDETTVDFQAQLYETQALLKASEDRAAYLVKQLEEMFTKLESAERLAEQLGAKITDPHNASMSTEATADMSDSSFDSSSAVSNKMTMRITKKLLKDDSDYDRAAKPLRRRNSTRSTRRLGRIFGR